MYKHAPKDYKCPICLGVAGIESENTLIRRGDIVYVDDLVTAFISSFSVGKNIGHVVIVPNKHFENIYELPSEYGHRIYDLAKRLAITIRAAYNCDGITTMQNNEPAGDQHAFHFHFHVFPRYKGDNLHTDRITAKKPIRPEIRQKYADRLKTALKSN